MLHDFSLTIEGGKKTAFVGVSGSGKSTLIKLVAGYIHPQRGEVMIVGQALPNETNSDYVSLNSYYKHIGYLTQEPNVFDGTIYENLTYALDYEPTKEAVDSAIE
ncbi:ATP-binding cassette domain-containing protein [Patescibacteria group bacterium]|nr:ATP-binding cassette domain-containing protein [Patescibacteria group bacterium]